MKMPQAEDMRLSPSMQEIANALERSYPGSALTLGKLRAIVRALDEIHARSGGSSPSVADVAARIRDLGIGDLSFNAVLTLVEATGAVVRGSPAQEITLKELEQLLTKLNGEG